MRSKTQSLKVPWPLVDEMAKICQEEGYDNANSCWLSAAIFFCLMVRRRRFIRAIAKSKPKRQSILLEQIFAVPHEDPDALIDFMSSAGTNSERKT